jgi:hypothetical protein
VTRNFSKEARQRRKATKRDPEAYQVGAVIR